jgi:lysozyme
MAQPPNPFEAAIQGAPPPVDPAVETGHRLSHEANGHTAHAGNETPDNRTPGIGPHTTGERTTGIDVSEFQNTIDWPTVQQSGVQFAYIRATDGTTIVDSDFVSNWQNAEKAGVKVGPYHYFTTTSPVQTQIDNFVTTLGKVDKGDLPPVIDVEDPTQFAKLTPTQSIALVQQMLDGVQAKLGVKPMVYMSSSFATKVLGDPAAFDSYKLWVADYTTAPDPIVETPSKDWTFWQHADNGTVPGITGGVDVDYFNGSPDQLNALSQPAAAAAAQLKLQH